MSAQNPHYIYDRRTPFLFRAGIKSPAGSDPAGPLGPRNHDLTCSYRVPGAMCRSSSLLPTTNMPYIMALQGSVIYGSWYDRLAIHTLGPSLKIHVSLCLCALARRTHWLTISEFLPLRIELKYLSSLRLLMISATQNRKENWSYATTSSVRFITASDF